MLPFLLARRYTSSTDFRRFQKLVYRIEYSPDSEEHLRFLTTRQQAIIFDTLMSMM